MLVLLSLLTKYWSQELPGNLLRCVMIDSIIFAMLESLCLPANPPFGSCAWGLVCEL